MYVHVYVFVDISQSREFGGEVIISMVKEQSQFLASKTWEGF